MLTGSGDTLLWSSGGGVAAISWGGAKAESLLLLTNRGVSGWGKIELETHHLQASHFNVFYLTVNKDIILYLISQTPNAPRITRGGREKRRREVGNRVFFRLLATFTLSSWPASC